jgi:hypothetical protein
MDKERAAVQTHWERIGAPRVVLNNTPYRASSKHHTVSSTNAQIGGLILQGLSSVKRGSLPKSTSDPYTERLLDLAGWLQDESMFPCVFILDSAMARA